MGTNLYPKNLKKLLSDAKGRHGSREKWHRTRWALLSIAIDLLCTNGVSKTIAQGYDCVEYQIWRRVRTVVVRDRLEYRLGYRNR